MEEYSGSDFLMYFFLGHLLCSEKCPPQVKPIIEMKTPSLLRERERERESERAREREKERESVNKVRER